MGKHQDSSSFVIWQGLLKLTMKKEKLCLVHNFHVQLVAGKYAFLCMSLGSKIIMFSCVLCLQYGAEGVEPLVSEDKVMFGIHGHAKSVLTLAKIRKHFRKTDTRAVAREV